MNLHILFAPVQTSGADDSLPPPAVLPLILDEELQYRCAGFIQAEIERFSEDIEELSPPPSEASGSDNDMSADEGDKRTKGKGKQAARNGTKGERHTLLRENSGAK